MTLYYHRTLFHSASITHSVLGNFLDENKEDIIVSTGRFLKLLRFEPNLEPGEAIQTLISEDTYDGICSLLKFRRKDKTKDWILFTTDSGNITMLAVDAINLSFELVLQEEFRAKIQRTLPIQHLSAASQGHAVIMGAVESLKQVWFFSDPKNDKHLDILDIPEENYCTKILLYDIAFVDINSENLVIAYLAIAYEFINQTLLQWLKLWDKIVFGKDEKKQEKTPKPKKPKKFKPSEKLIEDLDEHGRPCQKVAFLCGSPGLDKTTLATIIERLAGYNVVEINASEYRNPEAFRTALEAATQMKSVLQQDSRPNCLILDKIDGTSAASVGILVSFIKSIGIPEGQKHKEGDIPLLTRPIICICNNIYSSALKQLGELALVLHFQEKFHAGSRYELRDGQRQSLVFCEVNQHNCTEIKRIECLDHANSLISVPGEKGVLVCAEDFIAYYSIDSSDIIRCSIPKRIMDPKKGVIFVCSTKYNEKNSICYLAQTEQGDIFKIQLVINNFGVNEIILKYFITLPVASLCALESGFLFVASEFGDHHFYKISDIEKHTKIHPSFSSALNLPEGKHFLFMHRTLNIEPVAKIKSMSPIMQMEFYPSFDPFSVNGALSPYRSRMCLATGRASLSSLKISSLPHDVSYEYRVKIDKEIDEIPLLMWAIESTKSTSKSPETLIVVSFESSTAVYSLEKTKEFEIKKIEPTIFNAHLSTIGCVKTGEDEIVQISPQGICVITNAENILIYATDIESAAQNYAINKKSLIVAFANKDLLHYEIAQHGHVQKPQKYESLLNGPVTCMVLSDKIESDQLLAVGVSISYFECETEVNEVHLFFVSVSEIKFLCMLRIESSPYSILFSSSGSKQESLLVGCEDGALLTLIIQRRDASKQNVAKTTRNADFTTNYVLTPFRSEKIGSQAVQLLYAPSLEDLCILAISDHSWLRETARGDFIQLKSDLSRCICVLPERPECQIGIATIMEDSFRIFLLKHLMSEPPVTLPLEYTPKNISINYSTDNIFIIEADANSYTEETREKKKEFVQHLTEARSNQPASNSSSVYKIPRSWASVCRGISLSNKEELFKIPFKENEAALSFCHTDDGSFLLVGVAKGFNLATACCEEASIHLYKMETGKPICFLNKKLIKSAPIAMCSSGAKIWIGSGRKLALYCLITETHEVKQICEKKECVSNSITAIYSFEDRILVSDSKLGISCLLYDTVNQSLHLIGKDINPVELTAACILSNYQMARATRSRDIFIVELGKIEERDMSRVYKGDELPYTVSKEKLLACFHVGEVVTSMQMFKTFPNEPGSVVYTTLSGSVGILSPIPWKKDAKFLKSLNTAMLKTVEKIDKNKFRLKLSQHFHFRSRHFKCENLIDGDFLDQFLNLEVEHQEAISNQRKKEISQNLLDVDSPDQLLNLVVRKLVETIAKKIKEKKIGINQDLLYVDYTPDELINLIVLKLLEAIDNKIVEEEIDIIQNFILEDFLEYFLDSEVDRPEAIFKKLDEEEMEDNNLNLLDVDLMVKELLEALAKKIEEKEIDITQNFINEGFPDQLFNLRVGTLLEAFSMMMEAEKEQDIMQISARLESIRRETMLDFQF